MSDREQFFKRLDEACAGLPGWRREGHRLTLALEAGRHQSVEIEFMTFEQHERVRFYSEIGSVERIDPLRLTSALRLNFGLPYAALAVRDDTLVLVATASVTETAPRELEACARYLGEMADHFERTMYGPDEH
ncbi:MAG: hypothetical protein MJE66_00025 [Proteobacteria bacterium]|nr:hypothetical protein [Pseudomonadota bacterium]